MKKNIFFTVFIIFFILFFTEGCGEGNSKPTLLTPQNISYNGATLLALPTKIDIVSRSIEIKKVANLPNELLCVANKLLIPNSLEDVYIGSMNLKECFLNIDLNIDYKVSLNRGISPQIVAIYINNTDTDIITPKEIVYKIGNPSSEQSWGSFNIDVVYSNNATAKYIFRDTISRFAQSSIIGSYSFSYKGMLNDITATLSKSNFFYITTQNNTGKRTQSIISSSFIDSNIVLTSTKIISSDNNEKIINEIQTNNKDNGTAKIVQKIINKSNTNDRSIKIISQNIDIHNNIIETNIVGKNFQEAINAHLIQIKKVKIEPIQNELDKLIESFIQPIVDNKLTIKKPSNEGSMKPESKNNQNTVSVTVVIP